MPGVAATAHRRRFPFIVFMLNIVLVVVHLVRFGGQPGLTSNDYEDSSATVETSLDQAGLLKNDTILFAVAPSSIASAKRAVNDTVAQGEFDSAAGNVDVAKNTSAPVTSGKSIFGNSSNTTVFHVRETKWQFRRQNFTCPFRNVTWTFPVFPHFIIVGAQKAGTTAIANLLREVPNVLGSKRPEAHFWDLKAPHRLNWTEAQKCLFRHKYLQKFPQRKIGPDTIVFEKTPVLVAKPSKAAVIRSMLDPYPPKIVIILRDPVERYYSSYKMTWQNSGASRPTFPSVEEFVTEEVRKLRKMGILEAPPMGNATEWDPSDFAVGTPTKAPDYAASGILRGIYAPQVRGYMKEFSLGSSLKIIRYEYFISHRDAVMNDLLEFVGGAPYDYADDQLQQQLGPLKVVKEWYPPINNRTRDYLKLLFKPFNDELADLLGEEWRGVWD